MDESKTPDGKERLKRLSLNPLSLEDALRGAMQVPPPKDESKAKGEPADEVEEEDEPESPEKPESPF